MKQKNIKITAIVFGVILFAFVYYAQLRGIINISQSVGIGPLTVHWYGLALILAAVVLWAGFTNESKKFKKLQRVDSDLLFVYILIPALLGARLYHVITDWYLYAARPWEALFLWQGGLGIYGAVIGGILGIWVYCRARKLKTLSILDLLVVFLPLSQFIGRNGNLINRELFGTQTDLPWGLFVPGRPGFYQPSFLYEQIGSLILFFVLWRVYKKYKFAMPGQGVLLAIYLIGYGLIRFLVDFSRLEPRVFLGLTSAQLVSLMVLGCGIIVLKRKVPKLSFNPI